MQVSCAKMIYRQKRNKNVISPNTQTMALVILQPAVLLQQCNHLQVFFKDFAKTLKPGSKKSSFSNVSEVAVCRCSAK